ncbi:MAG: NAD(P)/FAD-dependent oxidoreductase [bacterium]
MQPSAAIIGAGPAGAAAAVLLARAGWRTTLLESRPFPRIKVCGECISPAATPQLHRLLPPEHLRRLGAVPVSTFSLHLPQPSSTRTLSWHMPAPTWALSRGTLDLALTTLARDAGAVIAQPATVRAVHYHADHVALTTADGHTLPADLVSPADGDGRHDAPPAPPAPPAPTPTPSLPGVLGLKCHLRPPTPFTDLAMHALPAGAGYLGTVPIEDNLVTVALVARTSALEPFGNDFDAALTALWPGFDPAWRLAAASPWVACGVAASGYRPPGHLRSFRIGNAAAAVEPVGGEGIGNALWAAETLTGLLTAAAPLSCASLTAAQHALARAYRARVRVRRPACRTLAEVLMRPRLLGALWPLLQAAGTADRAPHAQPAPGAPWVMAPWWHLLGKAGG